MKVSYNWLLEYVDISCSVAELAEKMTMAGIEVEAIETAQTVPTGIVVGEILERNPHPNADKLSVCRVFDGEKELQIVCGAPNCDAGKKVPLATIGTVFTDPKDGSEFKIKKGKLRGEKSMGMLCSADELGLGGDHSGLLELDNELKAGTPLHEIYCGDTVFEVEITPNRPDWLSHWGIARDVACLLNAESMKPEVKLPSPINIEATDKLVTIEDKELCPRYTARIIRNAKISESPEWLQERLFSIGLRPINNVVDITNFVLHELGHPLHTFDLDLLAEKRIIVRRAADGEKMTMLDDSELELKNHHLVIADAEKPVALAGVMGGANSGINENTTNILLESAAFFSSNIRATSRELGITSDSSYRFERGCDWSMVEHASARATQLILELTGGELVTGLVDVQSEVPEMETIICRFGRLKKLVGIDITNEKIIDIFEKLGLNVSDIDSEKCKVVPPLYRLDLTREADLAEEVARINGLDKIPIIPVRSKTVAPINKDAYLAYETLRDQIIGLGLYECMHYSMVSEKSALSDSRFTLDDVVNISNPLSLELACMRPSLLGEMLETVERNISRKNLNLKLFELGNVFCANPKMFKEERTEICIMLSGQKSPELFSDALKAQYDFYDLKGLIESLLEVCGIVNYSFKKVNDERFAPGQSAALLLNGKTAGHFGLLASKFTKGFRSEYPIFTAQIEVSEIFKAKTKDNSLYFTPVPQYPATTRDVAFVADKSLEHQTVIEFIENAKIKNFESVKLFDIFTDDKAIGAGKKSMAYTLTFRNSERTLTDKEVNNAFEKLRRRMESQLNIELR
jgi:phenylalanyl-tRNA synthetase beta chain